MTTQPTQNISPDDHRLAALEVELARLKAVQEGTVRSAQAEREALESSFMRVPAAKRDSWSARLQARQAAQADAGLKAIQERDRLYQQQLERSRPRREKLQAQIGEIVAAVREAEARHQAAVGQLTAKCQTLREQLERLEAPPALPVIAPDYDPTDKDFFTHYGVPFHSSSRSPAQVTPPPPVGASR
jgi:chromosome segregation ATPase